MYLFFFSIMTGKKAKSKGVISIPVAKRKPEVRFSASVVSSKLLLQMDSSATAYGSTISKKVSVALWCILLREHTQETVYLRAVLTAVGKGLTWCS